MQQPTTSFGYNASLSTPQVIRLRELRPEQAHHVLTPIAAWVAVSSTVESLLSTGKPCRNRPGIGAEALVEEVQRSMGERGRYYRTMAERDPRMEACRRLFRYGEFVVLGNAFDRIVDVENDASRPGHNRWIITRFGRSADNAHALLRHMDELERRRGMPHASPRVPLSIWQPPEYANAGAAPLQEKSDSVALELTPSEHSGETRRKSIAAFMKEDVSDEARGLVEKSPSLQHDLKTLEDANWRIQYGVRGGGSYAMRDPDKVIVIDSVKKDSSTQLIQALSHESGHALYPYNDDYSSKEAFLSATKADEGAATMNNIKIQREIIANGGSDIGISGKNYETYKLAYDQYLKDGDADAARNVIGKAFGDEKTSTTGQNYDDYYGDWYDKKFPPKKSGK